MNERGLVWRWFRLVWRDSPGVLALIVVLSLGSAVLQTAFPWLWQLVVDEVRVGAGPVRVRELALWMVGVVVAQWVLYQVLQGARAVMNSLITWRARRVVFDHLSELGDDFYRRWRPGDLVTRLSDDAGEKISWFLCSGTFRALEAALIFASCLVAMLLVDVPLALWVILPLPLLLVAQAVAQGALGRRFLETQEAISRINDELATTFAGIRVVQASRLEQAAAARFLDAANDQRRAEVRVAQVQQAVFLLYGYGWQAALAVLLLAGGTRVISGELSLGEFVTFEGLVMTMVWPMFDVGMFVSRWMQAGVSVRRLEALRSVPEEASGGDERPRAATVEVEAASVVGDEGAAILDGVALRAAEGERVAVVGEVGAGKTTLLQLVVGSRSASAGVVRLGGVDMRTLDRAALSGFLAVVPQDAVLLSLSVRENIVLGRDIDDDTLARALDTSRLAQDLGQLPEGLDTIVGERGVTLSGGQQQRVALARALAGRPRVLVLDDATAALDADTEHAFWERLRAHHPDVTVLVATHRTGTLEEVDRIVVLDEGRSVQAGSHGELLATEGAYKRIYGKLEAAEVVA